MPFLDSKRTLNPNVLKKDPKPTRLLLGEDPKSVLILRSLVKFGGLLAAGVVIATSIVLKDMPLICMNLALTAAILAFQIYKITVDEDERFRLLIELLIILAAAGIATWIAYPLLVKGLITYLTILIFANYIATVANIAAYIVTFFSPFIVSCIEELLIWLKFMQRPSGKKFELTVEGHQVTINYIFTQHCKENNFPVQIPEQKEQKEQKQKNLITTLNKSIAWLDDKLKTVQSHFFASEVYTDKLLNLKKLIRETRKGNLNDLLSMFKQKRSSRFAKIITVRNIREKTNELFNKQNIEEINLFLKQYTSLSPISITSNKKKSKTNIIQEKQALLNTALNEAENYHRERFRFFNEILNEFAGIGIGEKPLPELSANEEKLTQ